MRARRVGQRPDHALLRVQRAQPGVQLIPRLGIVLRVLKQDRIHATTSTGIRRVLTAITPLRTRKSPKPSCVVRAPA